MVYIASPKSNNGDIHLKKFWKVWGKQKQNNEKLQFQDQTQTDTSIDPIEEVLVEPPEIPETFVEYYPLLDPHSYAAIVEDKKNELKYSVLEPTLTLEDETCVNEIKDILWDELFGNSKEFKDKKESEEFLKTKIEETIKKYKIEVEINALYKYQYYITRDFLNFGKIDGLMRDENIEDISCDGTGIPVFVWHRKYESIPSNIIFQTAQELENFVFKLAYLCGRHISIAQPLLDGTLPDGSRAQVTYGTEVTPKGSTFTIRKFKKTPLTITDLILYNALSTEMAAYFWFLIENRHSLMIGGDIGGGKTSMLNAISLFIRPTLKVVSIEDTQEIRLPHRTGK